MRRKIVGLTVAIASIAALPMSLQSGTGQSPLSDATPFIAGLTSWNGGIQVLGRFLTDRAG